ncbi:hypothetical protein Q0Z83_013220 [Actinoplanes sichuanensis]|uniref:DUF4132 domain-containing protein n=1 Tax=Actinoplanes sichuanensis TaxID=512349 RepID=A0ABW4A622_9ACTN|nr:DUF4132 domain-containing protein [Actinoplanes sichuanensis]BEL03131.1 hypothetical protein Q0Z83_013220 [Actinoplanes sichuanensis]
MIVDEGTWGLPEDWWHGLHPRRGGRPVPPVVVAHDPEKVRTRRDRIMGRLVDYDVGLLATTDDTPLGAAVAVLTTGDESLVDTWVARSGLPFVVQTVGEAFRLVDSGALWQSRSGGYERLWHGDDFKRAWAAARSVRRHLASTADDVDEILAGFRSRPVGRILSSYLMPTRVDWVDADCAAAASWGDGPEEWEWADHRHLRGALVLSASRVEHLDRLRLVITGEVLGYRDIGVVATVLDGVGPSAATCLAQPFYRDLFQLQDDAWEHRERLGEAALRIMAATPDDEAMRILLRETLDGRSIRPGQLLKSGALKRYPVRALRVLAERADAVSRDLAGMIRLDRPELGPEALRLGPPAPETVGRAWAELCDRPSAFDSADDRKRAIGALAAIPTEEAFGLVLDRVEQKYYRQALLAAAKRAPERAMRVFASRDTDPAVSELMRDHVLRYPAALSALDPADQARVRAIVGPVPGSGFSGSELPGSGLPGSVMPGAALPGSGPPGSGSPGSVPPGGVFARPVRAAGLPDWLVPARLPAGPLSPEDVRRLCRLLAASRVGALKPEIDRVRPLGDFAGFAWEIFEQWRAADYPSKNTLAMTALAAFGDDGAVRALAAFLPEWSSVSSRVRAVMDVFAAIGTDAALTQLDRLSRSAKTAVARQTAADRLASVARARGLRPEELADRILPDFGLDSEGRIELDYGSRRFTIGFDEQLQPWIADETGRRLTRLPKPTDDVSAAAQRWFADLKKEAKTVGAERVRSIEAAMVTGRRWTPEEFRRYLIDHPLTWQLTQRLLWVALADADPASNDGPALGGGSGAAAGVYADAGLGGGGSGAAPAGSAGPGLGGGGSGASAGPGLGGGGRASDGDVVVGGDVVAVFRVAEDRSFADLDDKEWTLPAGVTVGVAHPWHFAADQAAWAALFVDYAIIQPFPQVGRELTGRSEVEVTSFAGQPVSGRRLFVLSARGWRFSDGHSSLVRDFPGGVTVEIDYSPGYHWQEPDAPQSFVGVSGLDRLGPVAFSEVIRDLRYLTSP